MSLEEYGKIQVHTNKLAKALAKLTEVDDLNNVKDKEKISKLYYTLPFPVQLLIGEERIRSQDVTDWKEFKEEVRKILSPTPTFELSTAMYRIRVNLSMSFVRAVGNPHNTTLLLGTIWDEIMSFQPMTQLTKRETIGILLNEFLNFNTDEDRIKSYNGIYFDDYYLFYTALACSMDKGSYFMKLSTILTCNNPMFLVKQFTKEYKEILSLDEREKLILLTKVLKLDIEKNPANTKRRLDIMKQAVIDIVGQAGSNERNIPLDIFKQLFIWVLDDGPMKYEAFWSNMEEFNYIGRQSSDKQPKQDDDRSTNRAHLDRLILDCYCKYRDHFSRSAQLERLQRINTKLPTHFRLLLRSLGYITSSATLERVFKNYQFISNRYLTTEEKWTLLMCYLPPPVTGYVNGLLNSSSKWKEPEELYDELCRILDAYFSHHELRDIEKKFETIIVTEFNQHYDFYDMVSTLKAEGFGTFPSDDEDRSDQEDDD